MRSYSRPLGLVAIVIILAGAYFIGRGGRGAGETDEAMAGAPDPGYAARDAVVIETGYDGRERYRLKASVIRQHLDATAIDLEQLEMDYHPGAQARVAGEAPPSASLSAETWHLKSDHGRVRADGDDVQLSGNVVVTGTTPGGTEPITLRTRSMRINTPTEFIETQDPVTFLWSGHEMTAVGMNADLKAGKLRLESDVHGEFSPK
jgi:LPS export ABC transporter protein LptC